MLFERFRFVNIPGTDVLNCLRVAAIIRDVCTEAWGLAGIYLPPIPEMGGGPVLVLALMLMNSTNSAKASEK
jgi:hypothetical protein